MTPVTAGRSAGLAQRAGLALADALRRDHGGVALGLDGRMRTPADGPLASRGRAPRAGAGGRATAVAARPCGAPGSAAALAVSSFAPWRACPERLPLAGAIGFEAFQFDVRCPTGLRGTPPHLELLALRPDRAVAVVARCTEYLLPRRGRLAPTYDRLFEQGERLAPWRDRLRELRARPNAYRHLDAAALVKHALALAHNFPDRPASLLYLFWEPLDADAFPEFHRHREELRHFAQGVADSKVSLGAQSFEGLWRGWAELESGPDWLPDHLGRLRARYAVAIGGDAGL